MVITRVNKALGDYYTIPQVSKNSLNTCICNNLYIVDHIYYVESTTVEHYRYPPPTAIVSLSLPIGLVTVHVYVPLSLVVTLLITKLARNTATLSV